MGFERIHTEPVKVQVASPTTHIFAHNEYWFLTAVSIPATTTIVSDFAMMNADESVDYAGYNFFGFQEFGGNIFIDTGAGNINMEFYRAIPN